jgi:tRNA threonylcarbamoyl adenosine modification protein YeaZ
MNILVLDTSAAQCAAALVCDGAVAAARSEPMTRGHGERLFALVEAVLHDAQAVDLIVACTGPGSFTGVRIGVAATRGLALGLGAPAVGVDLFAAIAAGSRGPVTVMLPAPGGGWAVQRFVNAASTAAATLVDSPPACANGETLLDEAALGEERMAALAAVGATAPRMPPAPLYLRAPDAALPTVGPAPLLP